MSDTPALGDPRHENAARLDRYLNGVLGLLGVAVLALGAYFGYSVYANRMAAVAATPALRLIEQAKTEVRADPNNVSLRVRLGEALGAAGKYDAAVEQFKAALELDPDNVGAYLDLGAVAMASEELDRAKGYMEKVLELTEGSKYEAINSQRETALFNLGLIANQQNRYEDAIGAFKGAIRIRRDASDTYYNLAESYRGLGDNDLALEQLSIALTFDPNYARAHFLAGEIYLAEDDMVNASYHLQRAAELAPNIDPVVEALSSIGSFELHFAKATEASEAGEWDFALNEILIARNLDPRSVKATLLHAQILEKRSGATEALRIYRQALELDSENAVAKAAILRLDTPDNK